MKIRIGWFDSTGKIGLGWFGPNDHEDETEDQDQASEQIRAFVFGELFKLAVPYLRSYTSDLYHDATWIKTWVKGPTTFYWGVRKTGTSIGTDETYVSIGNEKVYRITLIREGRAWYLDITPDPNWQSGQSTEEREADERGELHRNRFAATAPGLGQTKGETD